MNINDALNIRIEQFDKVSKISLFKIELTDDD